MNRKNYGNVMVLASITYGLAVGFLAMGGVAHLGMIAAVGGAALALGWISLGMFTKPDNT